MARMTVRYVGIADERRITARDLEGVGVDASALPTPLVWSRQNGFRVDMDVDDLLEEVLKGEGHFTLSAATDSGEERLQVNADDPDNEGDTLVDGDTGDSTTNKRSRKSA